MSEVKKTELFKVCTIPGPSSHIVRLSGAINSEGLRYAELLDFLDTVPPDDTVEIQLNNYGGDCQTGVMLAYAIKECAAHTVIKVKSRCYSMGAIIALCGDNLGMYPGAYLMFHNYTSGRHGKGAELRQSIEEFDIHWRSVLNTLCAPFLTKKEIDKLSKDQDVYVHAEADDIQKRLDRHFK